MRVIKSDTGFLYYEKILKQIQNSQSELVLWQVSPSTGERSISDSKLNSYSLDSGRLFFEIQSKEALTRELPLYCYVEAGPLIFKTELLDFSDTNITVKVPEEIKVLEEAEAVVIHGSTGRNTSDVWKVKRLDVSPPVDSGPDVMRVKSMSERSSRDQELLNNEFGLSVDEEDKIFAGKRASPRARPKDDKWVKIAQFQKDGPTVFKLFDLSRGGLSFVVFDEAEFVKGNAIHIVGFNDFDLDDPLVGKIMSVRPIEAATPSEMAIEFKVGVKFSEGQD